MKMKYYIVTAFGICTNTICEVFNSKGEAIEFMLNSMAKFLHLERLTLDFKVINKIAEDIYQIEASSVIEYQIHEKEIDV